MALVHSVLELIGNTPMVRLHSVVKRLAAPGAEVLCKLEYFNPAASIKDRLALAMVEDAEASGALVPGRSSRNTIVEPTSGNTGIGLALVAAVRGYRLILTMPDDLSQERQSLLRGLGAEVVLTPAAQGMQGAVEKAYSIVEKHAGAVLLQQFSNPAGPEVHYRTTAREIWSDCQGRLDIVVAGIGTGGTISGVARFLREKNPDIRIIGVELAESPVLSGGARGVHRIQGIGAGFVPEVLDRSLIDSIRQVSSADALVMARRLIREEGILCGISSGAMGHVALALAADPRNAGKRILFFAMDTAERYISTELFEHE